MDRENLIEEISKKIEISKNQIASVLELLEEGATVPFIARYRKEATGALDENQIRIIKESYDYEANLAKRKDDVIRLIDEKGLLTDELKAKILKSEKLIEVEDLYLPFKEKKKTKATEAIKAGLEPLAKFIMTCPQKGNVSDIVKPYICDLYPNTEKVLEGASYIIAEIISDDAYVRKIIRHNMDRVSSIVTKKKKNALDPKELYANYYDYSESTRTIKDHRILAINRAENEDIINVSIEANDEQNIDFITHTRITRSTIFEQVLKDACKDSYKRLILPSLTRELRSSLTLRAETSAIGIFQLNLKALLLQPPLKDKVVLGVDPAFRTGCKLAVVDQTGKMLEIAVIKPTEEYPGSGVKERDLIESEKIFTNLIKKYKVDVVTIGNGTASRETESFVANTIEKYKLNCSYVIVSEAGASVYSASKIAQDEFPTLTLEKRSAVSIARRIQDPLAELVKIEPKSIGVGQYQHDVDPKMLDLKLTEVVEDTVNSVGVDLNTASASLLTYISGLNKTIAQNIVEYRNTNGKFKNRKELLKVAKLGPKTYEMACGFLRVYDGTNPLDKTSIHPESYDIAENVMNELNIDLDKLGHNETINKVNNANVLELEKKFNVDKYTLKDILDSFAKPVRDIRDNFDAPILKKTQTKLEDLHIGDKLEGTVRNVVDFGCFVDCGMHEDGLVHVSKMSKSYVKHPSDLVKVGDIVTVYVISIDLKKGKLGLSMIKDAM